MSNAIFKIILKYLKDLTLFNMANGIRTGDPHGINTRCSSNFHEGSRVRQTEKGMRIYRPKHSGNNNKDEDNSPKILNDKNHEASSQKFRQLVNIFIRFGYCLIAYQLLWFI